MTKLLIVIATFFQQLINPALIYPTPSSNMPVNQLTSQPVNLIRYGFLPYWNLKYLDSIQFQHLTHLAYFSLPITADGTLNKTDIGYRRFAQNYDLLSEKAKQNQLQLDLVITAPNDNTLFTFLNDRTAHSTFIRELTAINTRYPTQGINIDFEPNSATDSATANALTQFVSQLKIENWQLKISMDIYPSAASSPKLWDLANLAPNVDAFIVMAYDYHRPGSGNAGPIAPIYLADTNQDHAILKNISQISQYIPLSQIVLGIPLYGYEWQTQSPNFLSGSTSRGSLATLKRINTLINSTSITMFWDSQTLTPWLQFSENGLFHQIYYDNQQSYLYKVQIVSDAGLGGYAFWSLGYEPSNFPWIIFE